MIEVFTIGYEGATVEDFIATLSEAGVEQVLDIRELPQSRRRGFSKTALAASLQCNKIAYAHLRSLGDPKAGREAARRGAFTEFKQIFEAHLSLPETRAGLLAAAELIKSAPTAFLCFERDPKHCHRALVVERLSELCSLSVRHLGVVEHASRRSRTVTEAA